MNISQQIEERLKDILLRAEANAVLQYDLPKLRKERNTILRDLTSLVNQAREEAVEPIKKVWDFWYAANGKVYWDNLDDPGAEAVGKAIYNLKELKKGTNAKSE